MLLFEAEYTYIHYMLLLGMCSTHTGGKASCAHSPHVLAFSFALSTQINIPAHRLPRPMHLPRLPRASCVSRVPLHLRLPHLLSPASVVFPASPALASAVLLTTLPAWPTRSHTMLPAWIHNVHTHSHPGPLDHTHNAPSLAHPITHTPSPRARRGSAAC